MYMQNIRGSAPPEVLSARVGINVRGSDPPEKLLNQNLRQSLEQVIVGALG